jgi:hypothetical protein
MGKTMSETFKYQNEFKINQVGNLNAGDTKIEGNQIGIQHKGASEKTLAEAAKEIQDLLVQLQTSYPTTTDYQKQVFVNKFNEEVKTNSNVRETLLAGGIELIKILCPPLGIPIEMGKRWLESAKHNQ